MPVKREPCRYYQRGSCQYGDKCRYLHVTQQQPKSNIYGGFGSQSGSDQHQKSNPYGFGVHNNSQSKAATDKPFENKWTRPSPATATATPSSRRSDNQPQTTNHECTNPESCRSIINEDFERERPLWKLTCYGHSRNSPCDIVGDISYEELRAVAYDDAKRGLNLQSIVERERNLVNTKSIEFENLRKPRAVPLNSTVSQSPFASATANAFLQTPQSSAPPSVSSFSQFGTSLNVGFGQRPSAPANNGFFQPSLFTNSSHASSGFGTNNIPSANVGSLASQSHNSTRGSIFTHNVGFGNTDVMRPDSNQISSSAVPSQFPSATSSQPLVVSDGRSSASISSGQVTAEAQSLNNIQREKISGDMSIWLKKKWTPGEVPEEEPPDALVQIDL
ncbi:zinc finger CCCH domain-containing protein 16 [Rosa sericea]